MKIHEVFERKIGELRADKDISGILVTGSLARATETEYSDLDIIVISNKDEVVEEVIDGVPVETHYNRAEQVKKWFVADPPSCYLYTYGKIIFDQEGVVENLVNVARERLANYDVTDLRKAYLNHKLNALKEKLVASLNLNDDLKIHYLIYNNFKVIVESIYAINSLPVPPQGLSYEIFDTLKVKPNENWLKKLITLRGREQAEFALEVISFWGNSK